MWLKTCLLLVTLTIFLQDCLSEDPNFFLSAAKSVPRIGRNSNKNNNNNADFEKFFLKASKSVPRIGRRNMYEAEPDQKEYRTRMTYPTWSQIAERYEFDPELFTSAELLEKLEQQMGDDPSVYDWEKVRFKRELPKTKKLLEN